MQLPKVLVGCPTYDGKEYCLDDYISGLYSLTYGNFDVCIADNSKKSGYFRKLQGIAGEWHGKRNGKFEVIRQGYSSPEPRQRIVEGKNMIREVALDRKYDYFLSLEQDVVAPADFIERLLSRGKDIISGTYFNFVPKLNSLVVLAYCYKSEQDRAEERTSTLGILDLCPGRVIENLRATGVGCILIRREVLEGIKFRFVREKSAFDDWWFCTDAIEKGYSINLDTSMLCKHICRPWLGEE